MNDQERFESGIEQIEKKVDEALIEKRDADQRQTHLSEALAAIEGDGKLASLLQRRLSDAESRLNEVEEQIRHYKDVVRRISDEMLALHDRNLHSREVLEQLESIGADVSDGYEVLHRRQLLFDKCREQLREISEKLEMENPLPNLILSVSFDKKNAKIVKGEVDAAKEELLAYIRDHHYSPQDWDTFIQDAKCRMLVRKIDRNYKLPPMAMEEARRQLDAYMTQQGYDENDYDKYSGDPEWRYLMHAAAPFATLPPRKDADNIGGWGDSPVDETISEAVAEMNRNCNSGGEWRSNCQRCVPAFEMRLRGYDVTAAPRRGMIDHLAYHPEDAWENPVVQFCGAYDNRDYISQALQNWGDGARVQIVVVDKYDPHRAHTFMALRNNGKTMFLDPQTGDEHAEECFDWAELSLTRFWRIDNLQPSAMVMDCCLRETGEGDSYGRI